MNSRALAAAVAVIFALSMPRDVAAKGNGGGHSGGGHSGGGHSGGHAGGGHSASARSSGGQARSGGGGARTGSGSARGGASQPAPAPAGTVHGGGRMTAGASPAGGASQPHTGSRSPNGHLVVGTAAPRSPHAQIVLPVAPTIYLPQIFRPHFVGFGFGYGVRRLGLGYSGAYYGLAYDHPLFCGDMIDCYAAPVYGAVEAPAPYEAPPAAPDEAATILLQVQPTSAQIFVDGEFVGTVDDLQSALIVAPGVHRVEFRAPGYDPLVVDVRVAPGGRITYRASLKPSA